MPGKSEPWNGNKGEQRKRKKMEVVFFERASVRMRRSGRRVVRSPNPVHSVLYRVVVFVNASRRRFLLQVEFRARILRVVYVGAIAVLFRFVVMMLNLSEPTAPAGAPSSPARDPGQIFGGMTLRLARVRGGRARGASDPLIPSTLGLARPGEAREGQGRVRTGTYVEWVKRRDPRQGISGFGQVLYGEGRRYVVAAGMVLLVAMVGSIVLTLKVRSFARAKRQHLDQQRSRDADRAIMRVKNR
jgi:NADH-quinone oxidoreductase subunit J